MITTKQLAYALAVERHLHFKKGGRALQYHSVGPEYRAGGVGKTVGFSTV
ncbi:MAG: hypothetical protein NVV73_05845 [Cellvibrionaceae bacterium]|nr:hypothetical protein [Cellvibrionaceae bacterium]